ncbi:hypothetical protein MHYP_G00332400 [Metynnis hypsauchen]
MAREIGEAGVAKSSTSKKHKRKRSKKESKTRIVHANILYDHAKGGDNPNRHYANNKIKTTKYTLLSFIPKNLFEQFHRFANVYFVFIALLNFVPVVNAFQPELALAPVVFILSVTAIKDLWEDYRRHRSPAVVHALVEGSLWQLALWKGLLSQLKGYIIIQITFSYGCVYGDTSGCIINASRVNLSLINAS